MCGFIAVYTHTAAADSSSGGPESPAAGESNTGSALRRQLERSLELIKHRGPDGCDVWVDDEATVGLGHCRLAINDTSLPGSQPLHSADDQIHAVVIGEIYEYEELRRYYEGGGYTFRGHSDSELVLALYIMHGAPGLFRHLRGEFSFVIVDERADARKVIAARDRFGIKPLFWTVDQGRVLFAAEAKAFLGLGWTPATMFQGVRKVAPGYWMEIGPESALSELGTRPYSDQQYATNAARDDGEKHDEDSVARMVQSVREKLVDAVRVRLRADVPMGLYLSGGIDSSAVAGIVAHLVSREGSTLGSCRADAAGRPPRIKCFTVGYIDATYDESDIAASIQKLADNLEDSIYHTKYHIFDLNTTAKSMLSSLPREHGIRSVLSGEGSGEHFAGYYYFTADFIQAVRSGDERIGYRIGPKEWHDTARGALLVPAGQDLCQLGARRAETVTKTLLPNTILTGVGDRFEMRNSIEGWPPFLDHHLAEHVNALPPSVKMRYSPDESQGRAQGSADDYWWKGPGSGLRSVTEKWILREAVRPFVACLLVVFDRSLYC
ncbi:uncharacterized protein LMH87_007597 [Akanthomyces muscarius]|uniref:asparagine synthase (glutamine-hydrolyzing) n=1 Tax=Akanthomyces muscarius TaxID=2231603 RepID=A0A9W8QK25_AKAMU|nr:uncharacterized protein LMH87_007597 [Akanthomyces muscarius]KAJ4161565.1 hypothetical protein LMH87_007597 [Akanthomyces muscarius]